MRFQKSSKESTLTLPSVVVMQLSHSAILLNGNTDAPNVGALFVSLCETVVDISRASAAKNTQRDERLCISFVCLQVPENIPKISELTFTTENIKGLGFLCPLRGQSQTVFTLALSPSSENEAV